MDSTLLLLLATVVFLGLHVLPSTPLRALTVRLVGEGPYLGLFSLASLAGLAWMTYAYKQATFFALWPGLHLLRRCQVPGGLRTFGERSVSRRRRRVLHLSQLA